MDATTSAPTVPAPPPGPPAGPPGVVAALAREQAAFAALAARVDPAVALATCPSWTAGDLVRHVAGVYQWAAAAVRTPAHADLPDDDPFHERARAEDHRAAAAALRAALDDLQRPCPTLVGRGTASWWARRQLHETFVHRLDLALAAPLPGSAPWVADTDPVTAADCIAEVVDTMAPRQVRLGRMAAITTGLRLTTPSRSWDLGPDPVAEVSGPDAVVAALLWRRTPVHDPLITVTGDRDAATALLAEPLTP